MRLPTMSGNFLLAPIPEAVDSCLQHKNLKIAVLGASGVGKTAMIVRFLTKRFIGDYESNTGNVYSRLVDVEGEQLSLHIQDTPCIEAQGDCAALSDLVSRCILWAEGFILVYSVTDYSSYESVRPLFQHLRKVHQNAKVPVVIVGNKGDLLHARQVQVDKGIELANEFGAHFVEISTSESCEEVYDVFQNLCRDVIKSHLLCCGEKRRGSIIPRPRSPNMQDLKRRFKQALSSKVKASSTL
ncbi:ras-like protein family member 11A [Protopterus annectens]|uniref:ras-like protein family member 11A n=1 Tax=Protopterus annectens TaxID=7888 RepID=UPI001CFA5CE7|nr:ras-like protein family member 11A [Protopterus annectens]